ncbi:MAG: aminotransferase class IV [Saccharofermentanales bacterium]
MAYPLIDFNVGDKIMLNHRLVDIGDPAASLHEIPSEDMKYYEVVRYIDRTLIFFEDHMERMKQSVAGDIVFDPDEIREDAEILMQSLKTRNGNFKIVLTKDTQIIYKNKHYYPTMDEYKDGVNVGLMEWERRDPNVKAIREDYKKAIKMKLDQKSVFGPYFETLLFMKDGSITEGSRSNAFFVDGYKVMTAPDDLILKGITRKYIIEAIRNTGCELVMQMATVEGIRKSPLPAFITGTSIGVLPVKSIEDIPVDSAANPVIMKIMLEYSGIVRNYIKTHSKEK